MFYNEIKFMLNLYFDGVAPKNPDELRETATHIHAMGGYDEYEYRRVMHAINNRYDLILETFNEES